jgi:hypothetical protein
MVNAMNASPVLAGLLRQGEIPRLLNQELRERKQPQKAAEPPPKVVESSSVKTTARPGFSSSSDAHEPGAHDSRSEPSRGGKRKGGHTNDTPFAFGHVGTRIVPYA